MDKVSFITVEGLEGTSEHAIIDRGDGEFTSMRKADYDAMIKSQEELKVDEAKTK